MNEPVLVVAAHPDDEVLGCGATIAGHIREGRQVHAVILGKGVTSRQSRHARSSSELPDLEKAATRANEMLGTSSLTLLDFPDNRLDSVDRLDVIQTIESFVERFRPEMLYIHHARYVNIDHRFIHAAVITACRPLPGHVVKQLLFFEVASSTEWQMPGFAPSFEPNWFVDVSDTLELKLKALEFYQDEMRPWPHARSVRAVEHLARWRGATIGVEAAEAFVLGRALVKFEELQKKARR